MLLHIIFYCTLPLLYFAEYKRGFNSTLHAGKIKSYIQLTLAMSHQALIQKRASPVNTITDNPKYTFRTYLLRLGLICDEFKTLRQHLLEPLEGNIAWRNPEDALRQRESLRRKREENRISANQPNPAIETVIENDEPEQEQGFSMSM